MLNTHAKAVSSPSLVLRQERIHDIIHLSFIRTRTDCVDLPRSIE